jgi:hypothetical protein
MKLHLGNCVRAPSLSQCQLETACPKHCEVSAGAPQFVAYCQRATMCSTGRSLIQLDDIFWTLECRALENGSCQFAIILSMVHVLTKLEQRLLPLVHSPLPVFNVMPTRQPQPLHIANIFVKNIRYWSSPPCSYISPFHTFASNWLCLWSGHLTVANQTVACLCLVTTSSRREQEFRIGSLTSPCFPLLPTRQPQPLRIAAKRSAFV